MSTEGRRQLILKAAERLFEHYGHGKTTMADVAREANVGVGSVYLEFESKDAIVEALSGSTHGQVLEAMRAAATKNDRDDASKLIAVLLARTEAFLVYRSKGAHVCELLHCKTAAVKAAHDRFRAEELALLEGILLHGIANRSFQGVIAASRSASLIQRAFASLSPPWIFSVEEDAMTLAYQLCELLLRGVLARDTPPVDRKGSSGSTASPKPASRRGR